MARRERGMARRKRGMARREGGMARRREGCMGKRRAVPSPSAVCSPADSCLASGVVHSGAGRGCRDRLVSAAALSGRRRSGSGGWGCW